MFQHGDETEREKLSSTMEIRTPKLKVTAQREPAVITRIPLFGRPTITVNSFIAEDLDTTELEAILAHELSHVKYDAIAIRLTRWVSVISFFSCNIFALLLDMEKREIRADKVAARTIGNSQILVNALVKIIAYRNVKRDAKVPPHTKENKTSSKTIFKRLRKRITNIAVLVQPLFWPESNIGYTHPSLSYRLKILTNETGQ